MTPSLTGATPGSAKLSAGRGWSAKKLLVIKEKQQETNEKIALRGSLATQGTRDFIQARC